VNYADVVIETSVFQNLRPEYLIQGGTHTNSSSTLSIVNCTIEPEESGLAVQYFQSIDIERSSTLKDVSFIQCSRLSVSNSAISYTLPLLGGLGCDQVDLMDYSTLNIINNTMTLNKLSISDSYLMLQDQAFLSVNNASLNNLLQLALESDSHLKLDQSIITTTNDTTSISLSDGSTLEVYNTPVCPSGLVNITCQG